MSGSPDAAAGHASPATAKRKAKLHKNERAGLTRSQWKKVVSSSPAHFDGIEDVAASYCDGLASLHTDGIAEVGIATTDGTTEDDADWIASPLFEGIAEVSDSAASISRAGAPTAGHASPAQFFTCQTSPELFDIFDASDGTAEVASTAPPSDFDGIAEMAKPPPGLRCNVHASQVLFDGEYFAVTDIMQLVRYRPAPPALNCGGHADVATSNRDAIAEVASLRSELSARATALIAETAEVATLRSELASRSSALNDETAEVAKLRATELSAQAHFDGIAHVARLEQLANRMDALFDERREMAKLQFESHKHTAELAMLSQALSDAKAEMDHFRSEGIEATAALFDVRAEVAQHVTEGLEHTAELANTSRSLTDALAEMDQLRTEGLEYSDAIAEVAKLREENKLLQQLVRTWQHKQEVQQQQEHQAVHILRDMLAEEKHLAGLRAQHLFEGIAEEEAIARMYEHHLEEVAQLHSEQQQQQQR